MFMYLHKSKKGFTLIELMVVVAIIGILALLGLRLYLTQQQKAKDAIVKANAGTVQTLLQSELADVDMWATGAAAVTYIQGLGPANSGMQNPYDSTANVVSDGTSADGLLAPVGAAAGTIGMVLIAKDTTVGSEHLIVQGVGGDGTLTGSPLSVYK